MAVAGEQPGASWAAVAVSEQPAKGAAAPTAEAASTKSTAVIDANAIMGGFPLDRLAERLVTIPEVLEEVRDAKSRERLATLHVVLETLEPTDEAVAAGRPGVAPPAPDCRHACAALCLAAAAACTACEACSSARHHACRK